MSAFDEVLLVGEGKDIQVGKPTLSGTAVTAKVIQQGKSRKVPVVKFKRRQNYLRQGSHRQFFTEVEIVSIGKGCGEKSGAESRNRRERSRRQPSLRQRRQRPKSRRPKKAATKKPAAKKAAKKESQQENQLN